MRAGLREVIESLPRTGSLFPNLAPLNEKQRGSYFQSVCRRLKISGISLHSYRYAWAERAKTAGYPERFAQEALGHNFKAVHRAYAKNAAVLLPSLEDYEATMASFRKSKNPQTAPSVPGSPRPSQRNGSGHDEPSIPNFPAMEIPFPVGSLNQLTESGYQNW